MTIGNLVKTYRQEHDLPMQEFADRCGLSKSYISMLEKILIHVIINLLFRLLRHTKKSLAE